MKTSMVTPSFYYVFNISLNCNDTIPTEVSSEIFGGFFYLGITLDTWGHFIGAKTLYFFSLRPVLYYDYFIIFILSLHFTPGLQSAVCILPPVCILAPVCSLQSTFCTEWKFTEKELKVQATKEQMVIEGIKPSNTQPVCKCIYWSGERNGKIKMHIKRNASATIVSYPQYTAVG